MEGTWGIAAVWLGQALVASLLSIRFGTADRVSEHCHCTVMIVK